MKAQEVRVLEPDELAGKLKDSRRELYELRFKLAVGQLDDHRQIRKVRQDIARILTFMHQRQLGILRDDAATPTAAAVVAKPAPAKAEPEVASKSEEQE
ncbi:MAG: hypothetical protein NVS9B1_13800 [Candidatus Dormibacteraceae bacterium]